MEYEYKCGISLLGRNIYIYIYMSVCHRAYFLVPALGISGMMRTEPLSAWALSEENIEVNTPRDP